MALDLTALDSAGTAIYNQGVADGVASVSSPTGDVTAAQEQIDIAAAVASAIAPLNTQIASLQADDGAKTALLASVQTAAQSLVALFSAPASS